MLTNIFIFIIGWLIGFLIMGLFAEAVDNTELQNERMLGKIEGFKLALKAYEDNKEYKIYSKTCPECGEKSYDSTSLIWRCQVCGNDITDVDAEIEEGIINIKKE